MLLELRALTKKLAGFYEQVTPELSFDLEF